MLMDRFSYMEVEREAENERFLFSWRSQRNAYLPAMRGTEMW